MKYTRLHMSGEAVVVVFDMCSSTDVIEEATLSGNIDRLTDFLTDLKRYVASGQEKVAFDVYKFTGDGWILLFPGETSGSNLLDFLVDLCTFYDHEFYRQVLRYLGTRPTVTGLTFGIEKGVLTSLKMYGQDEYVGRALNVACRLQAAVKDGGKSPAYRALVSNRVFNEYFAPAAGFKVDRVTRNLRNIRGGSKYHCRKIRLFEKAKKAGSKKKP